MNDLLTGKAMIAGVMGWPISHSKSPRVHGYWLRQLGIDGIYIPLAVDPVNIEKALRALPVLGFRGCNLTIPHKELAFKIVDERDDLANRVGAVNTIIVHKDGQLEGRNTDVFGFTENLRSAGFIRRKEQKIATVLGAGGASRAIVVGLQDMGFSTVRIVNRDQARAQNVAETLQKEGAQFEIYDWSGVEEALDGCALFVNATSLGMAGQPPLDIDLAALPSTAWVTDAVYAPLQTELLKKAQHRNLSIVDGLGMLLHQARPGFAAWFGQDPAVTQELRDIVLSS